MSHSRLGFNTLATASLALALVAAAGCQKRSPSPASAPEPRQEDARAWAGATGRGTTATADELRHVRATRAEELLAGRFAGVQVFYYPGGISVRIRGTSSLLGSNEPLYVIDGLPVDAGPGGALLGINPNDIHRIEVLKDIGSTSYYGVRGANGVVLITTRRPR